MTKETYEIRGYAQISKRSPTTDFEAWDFRGQPVKFFDEDPERAFEILHAHVESRSGKSIFMHINKDEKNIYIGYQPTGTDASGRQLYALHGLRTQSESNPTEQLFDMLNGNKQAGSEYRIGESVTIPRIHFPKVSADVKNDLVSKLSKDKMVVCTPTELNALTSDSEILPYINWIVASPNKIPYSLGADLKKRGESVVFVSRD